MQQATRIKTALFSVLKPLCTLCLILLCAPLSADQAYRYADAHLHYVDFFQQTDGINKLLREMDKHQISNAQFSGVGMVKKWAASEPRRPRYYMGDDAPAYWYSATDALIATTWLRLEDEQRARLHPFITGFNPTDMNAHEHIQRMLELYPGVWQGIGEIFTRHDELTALTEGEKPRANHPALHKVYQLAAKHQLPVLLHSNITSVREKDELYLSELEEALSQHPQTQFIWAHAGSSQAILRRQSLPQLLSRIGGLLARYDNLSIDLSWALLDSHLLEPSSHNDGVQVKPAVIELLSAYPTRFMLGSDMLGRFKNLGKEIHRFKPVLDALPRATAQKVARDNFLNLLPKPIRLSANDARVPTLIDQALLLHTTSTQILL